MYINVMRNAWNVDAVQLKVGGVVKKFNFRHKCRRHRGRIKFLSFSENYFFLFHHFVLYLYFHFNSDKLVSEEDKNMYMDFEDSKSYILWGWILYSLNIQR